MSWLRALRQLSGISDRWDDIRESIETKYREQMQLLLIQALAASGAGLLELINQIMQIGLTSAAADVFREIGRASTRIPDAKGNGQPAEFTEVVRDSSGSATPAAAVVAQAAGTGSVEQVREVIESLLESVVTDPASYPNFKFEDVDRAYELPVNEGFISGYTYRLTVGIGVNPDQRFGGEGKQPERKRTPGPVIQLRIAIFYRGGGIRIEGDPLAKLEWPASGPSRNNAIFVLKALETCEPTSGQLDVYFYHDLNLIYTARFRINVKPDGADWSADERPISWAYREDKDTNRSRLFQTFARVWRLSPRAANLAIQHGDKADEYLLTAFVARAELPARMVLTRDEIDSQIVRMRSRMDRLRRSPVYLEGGYTEQGEYLGDFKGPSARFSRSKERLPARDMLDEWKSFITDMATIGSEFYDRLFLAESGRQLRSALEENLKDGDAIQVWIERDATDFVYPWAWLYTESVNPSKRVQVKSDCFWGYKYVIEQVARFAETISQQPRPVCPQDAFSIKVGTWNFVPTTERQREYFKKLTEENAGYVTCQISDSPEAFLGDCTSRIVYFFSHGHTAKPVSTTSQTTFDMARAWEEWLEKPPENESAWMREYRNRALAELGRLKDDVNAFSETCILLQNGRLLLREIEKGLNLKNDALVFLNMCESAQVFSNLSHGLIDAFLKKGARGVIGTEIPMVDSFADLFSRELFNRVLFGSGKTGPEAVGCALRDLRRKFLDMNNPFGFAYTYFGDASAKFGLVKQ